MFKDQKILQRFKNDGFDSNLRWNNQISKEFIVLEQNRLKFPNVLKNLYSMNQKKNWSAQQDEIIRKGVQQMGDRPRWKCIAQKINQLQDNLNSSNERTPKQCRQRWHNKLNPQIRDQQWDQEQINKLFKLHNEYGNKWSLIATMMNGRTDNCVKNKFYSALRKGMRKINKYIVNLKRKLKQNKNICIKQFKDVVLTKLIAVADKKYDDKLDVKEKSRIQTQQLSEAIKHALVQVSKNSDDYIGHVKDGIADDDYDIEENLFKNIQQFCRNCKRKKGKRKSDQQEQVASQMVDQSQQVPLKQQASKEIKLEQIQKVKIQQRKIKSMTSLPKEMKTKKQNIFEQTKNNQHQTSNKIQNVNNKQNSQPRISFDIKGPTNLTKVTHHQSTIEQIKHIKFDKMPTKQQQSTFHQLNNDDDYNIPFLNTIPSVPRQDIFKKTDLNENLIQKQKLPSIFYTLNTNNTDNSANYFLGQSGAFGGFIERQNKIIQQSQSIVSRSCQFNQEANSLLKSDSSLLSKIQLLNYNVEKNDTISNSQIFGQSSSLQFSQMLEDMMRRKSSQKH